MRRSSKYSRARLIRGGILHQARSATKRGSSIVSQGSNLIGNGTSASGFIGSDQIGTSGSAINPLLNALANNGGPTQTMSLQGGSPAISKGNCNLVPAVGGDQRGVLRKTPCDVGAYETPATAWIVNSTSDNATTCATIGTICLRNAIGSLAANGTITFANSVMGAITLSQGALTISQTLTIAGPGQAHWRLTGIMSAPYSASPIA